MSRDELRAIFGQTEVTGGTSCKYPTPTIWKYGELEFHFGSKADDKLSLIYMEQDEIVRISISMIDGANFT